MAISQYVYTLWLQWVNKAFLFHFNLLECVHNFVKSLLVLALESDKRQEVCRILKCTGECRGISTTTLIQMKKNWTLSLVMNRTEKITVLTNLAIYDIYREITLTLLRTFPASRGSFPAVCWREKRDLCHGSKMAILSMLRGLATEH